MPRAARQPEEINEVKESILDCALNIIANEGYESLTMRRMGSSLGCAAKTIYNYFNGKEEIYLHLLLRGFEKLNQIAEESIHGVEDPIDRLRALSKTYVRFGLDHTHYYSIMFSWDAPKYLSYIGTKYESMAWDQKAEAMHFASLAEAAITEALMKKGVESKEEVTFCLVRMWAQLHGYVSFHNSNSFHEYHPDTIQFKDRIVDEMVNELRIDS